MTRRWSGLCPRGKHGLDYRGQECDLCPPTRGNCYVTCEALYHLLGGKRAHLTPHTVTHEGAVHWYLVCDIMRGPRGSDEDITLIIDPTASQFKTTPDYSKGRGRGFLTKDPSKRARAMMESMVWQSVNSRPTPVSKTPRSRR